MTDKLLGLVAAAHSPFTDRGDLNLPAVDRIAHHLLRDGINTVFVAGTTGECHSLTVTERLSLTERWLAVAKGTELKVIVHVGANCLDDARILAAHAEKNRAHAIAALTPSYYKPKSIAALTDCCRTVASAAPGLPFYYYDIPLMTGVSLSMPDFLDAAGELMPTLAGIKFSNPDLMAYQRCLHSQSGRFDMPWGFDEFLLAALAVGGVGAVGGTYNFAAPIYHRMLAAFAAGKLNTARDEQYRSVQLVQALSDFGFIAATKAVMEFIGIPVGPPRLPNQALGTNHTAELRRRLERLGFFAWRSGS